MNKFIKLKTLVSDYGKSLIGCKMEFKEANEEYKHVEIMDVYDPSLDVFSVEIKSIKTGKIVSTGYNHLAKITSYSECMPVIDDMAVNIKYRLKQVIGMKEIEF